MDAVKFELEHVIEATRRRDSRGFVKILKGLPLDDAEKLSDFCAAISAAEVNFGLPVSMREAAIKAIAPKLDIKKFLALWVWADDSAEEPDDYSGVPEELQKALRGKRYLKEVERQLMGLKYSEAHNALAFVFYELHGVVIDKYAAALASLLFTESNLEYELLFAYAALCIEK